MEILKDKKLLVGGLAVIGGIALVSYLLKSKAPKRNSEGFFNAGGRILPITKQIPDKFLKSLGQSGCYIFWKSTARLADGSMQTQYQTKEVTASDDRTSGISFDDYKQAYYAFPKCTELCNK